MLDFGTVLAMTRQAIQEGDWKDTVLKILVGIVISSTGWYFTWAQGVVTTEAFSTKMQELEKHPPILRAIPNLSEKVAQVSAQNEKLIAMQERQIRLVATIDELGRNVVDLKSAVKELTQEMRNQK